VEITNVPEMLTQKPEFCLPALENCYKYVALFWESTSITASVNPYARSSTDATFVIVCAMLLHNIQSNSKFIDGGICDDFDLYSMDVSNGTFFFANTALFDKDTI
jgi:hypothetical protein